MQRIRMSLPYFNDFDWEAEVIAVDEKHSSMIKDKLLMGSIPEGVKIHKVGAFSKQWTSKIGLGSLALRSLFQYKFYVNKLLSREHFDLIYFSTTEYPLSILGAYWNKKFNIPYVIDIQDAWHTEYYKDKPKGERPKKYWFSYLLNKFLEPIAMKRVSGLISVSEPYLRDLCKRYPYLNQRPKSIITFGAFKKDFEIANQNLKQSSIHLESAVNLVYVGRGGHDLEKSLSLVFKAFKLGLDLDFKNFNKIRFLFIGTSYAPPGQQIKTILPLAEKFGVSDYVVEQTQRIGFYDSLKLLQEADGLLIPGSNDAQYTASKIYPYILARKPLLALFDVTSSAAKIIKKTNAGIVANLRSETSIDIVYQFMIERSTKRPFKVTTDWEIFDQYTAENTTQQQCSLFNAVNNKATD